MIMWAGPLIRLPFSPPPKEMSSALASFSPLAIFDTRNDLEGCSLPPFFFGARARRLDGGGAPYFSSLLPCRRWKRRWVRAIPLSMGARERRFLSPFFLYPSFPRSGRPERKRVLSSLFRPLVFSTGAQENRRKYSRPSPPSFLLPHVARKGTLFPPPPPWVVLFLPSCRRQRNKGEINLFSFFLPLFFIFWRGAGREGSDGSPPQSSLLPSMSSFSLRRRDEERRAGG